MAANTHELTPFNPGSSVDNSRRYNRSLWKSEEDLQYGGYTPDYGTLYDSDEVDKQTFLQKHRLAFEMISTVLQNIIRSTHEQFNTLKC